MFWFLSGMALGAFTYHFATKRSEPNYASIAYTKSQITEHEMMASYYNSILEGSIKPNTGKKQV